MKKDRQSPAASSDAHPPEQVVNPPGRVSVLNVEQFDWMTKNRLLVELVESGLGQSVRIPVVVARGKCDGPVFGITAALHGNELNGIPVIHQLLKRIDLRKLKGTIVAVIATNILGLLRQQREFIDGVDLNHIMPGDPHGNRSDVYAFNLIDRIAKHFDYLIDLHTASFGRVNSLYVRADMSNPITADMARLQRPQIILHDPPSDYTLRGALAEKGIPAITLEIRDPHRFQPESIRRSLTGVRRVLSLVGMLPMRKMPDVPLPIMCQRSYWMYTDRGGLLTVLPDVTDDVTAGDIIARQTNVFGDLVREYTAPQDGVIIGHSTDPLSQTGSRIVHLGVINDGETDNHAPLDAN